MSKLIKHCHSPAVKSDHPVQVSPSPHAGLGLSETPVASAGAGDLFASGFLYGMLRQYSLQKCCQMGCLAGGAIVQTLGAEMTASNWKWLFDRWLSHLLQAPARLHVARCQNWQAHCFTVGKAR